MAWSLLQLLIMATQKHMSGSTGYSVTGLSLEELHKSLKVLVDTEVLVGIPESTTERDSSEEATSGSTPPTNSMIGYVMENGMPEQNVPARPWLVPGIRENTDKIASGMLSVSRAVLKGADRERVVKMLMSVGMVAVSGIKNRIDAGIDPALADSTVARRAAKGRKGAKKELENRAKGMAPGTDLAKPLVDTGAFRNAINYVLAFRRSNRKR